MKLWALIHDDRFSENHDLYGIYTTKEKAEEALANEVPDDERANRVVRVIEYEADQFRKEGHFPEFERQSNLEMEQCDCKGLDAESPEYSGKCPVHGWMASS